MLTPATTRKAAGSPDIVTVNHERRLDTCAHFDFSLSGMINMKPHCPDVHYQHRPHQPDGHQGKFIEMRLVGIDRCRFGFCLLGVAFVVPRAPPQIVSASINTSPEIHVQGTLSGISGRDHQPYLAPKAAQASNLLRKRFARRSNL